MSRDPSSARKPDRLEARRPRPKAIRALVGFLAFQGLSGVAGGLGLALDPSGAALGIPGEWLEGSPFADFLIPGLVLLTLLGLGPLAVVYGVWTRRRWSWAGSLLVALGLFVWLGVEVAVIGYQAEPPLQLVYGAVAAIILAGALLPSVRDHLTPQESGP